MKNQLVTCCICACAWVLNITGSAKAANLVKNGDFTAGNSGFLTDYDYNSSNLWLDANYTIGANPNDFHSAWSPFGDRTTGTGKMQIVNGASSENINVWSQTIAVNPNTEYNFSAWLASLFPDAPAKLQFSINALKIGSPFPVSETPGLWQQFNANWYSESNRSATISMVNLNTDFSGNDFAVDDIWFEPVSVGEPPSTVLDPISFEPVCVPEPGASVALLTMAAFGFAALGKFKQQ